MANLLTPEVDHLIMEFSRGAIVDHFGRIVSYSSNDKVAFKDGSQSVDSEALVDSGSISKPVPAAGAMGHPSGTR